MKAENAEDLRELIDNSIENCLQALRWRDESDRNYDVEDKASLKQNILMDDVQTNNDTYNYHLGVLTILVGVSKVLPDDKEIEIQKGNKLRQDGKVEENEGSYYYQETM